MSTIHSRQDPRFLYLATHKLTFNTEISAKLRRLEFHRLDTTNLQLEFDIFAACHNLGPHPIPSHTTVKFKSLPYLFIATNFILFVSHHHSFCLLHGAITFLITLTIKIHF